MSELYLNRSVDADLRALRAVIVEDIAEYTADLARIDAELDRRARECDQRARFHEGQSVEVRQHGGAEWERALYRRTDANGITHLVTLMTGGRGHRAPEDIRAVIA